MKILDNFLVAGITSNSSRTIIQDVKRIINIFKRSNNFNLLIIESDSNDDTVNKLKELKKSNNCLHFISLGNLKKTLPNRIQRIAYCRNQYISKIRNDSKYNQTDYVLLIDLDNINYKLNTESILSCFKKKNWDAVFPNQTYKYYDSYALRYLHEKIDDDPWIKYYEDRSISNYYNSINNFYKKMYKIKTSSNWIRVNSAFGGAALYKKNCLIDSTYSTLRIGQNYICEHVLFNYNLIKKKYKLFINPEFINSGVNWHSIKSSFLFKIVFFIFYIFGNRFRFYLKKKGYISHH